MLPSNLFATTQADLVRLIGEGVPEGQYLDFKRALPPTWDDNAKRELAADVCAFANAGGGHLIYGLDEIDGVAGRLMPQVHPSVDELVRRMQDIIWGGLEPRLPGVQIHPIEVDADGLSGAVILVRIPQSWGRPHRVKDKQFFFLREGVRKRPMDVPEIRSMVLRSAAQAQAVSDFRKRRIDVIDHGLGPALRLPGPTLTLHVVPTESVFGMGQLDPTPYGSGASPMPMLDGAKASRTFHNFDGACGVFRGDKIGRYSTYTQLFRNGFWEAVWVQEVRPSAVEPWLVSPAYERSVITFLERVRDELSRWGLATEFTVLLTVLDADKMKFATPNAFGGVETHPFSDSTMIFPDALVPTGSEIASAMRPVFDLMYQSAGLDGSPHFDDSGAWVGLR